MDFTGCSHADVQVQSFPCFALVFQTLCFNCDFFTVAIYVLLVAMLLRDKYAIYTCHFITVQLKNCAVSTRLDLLYCLVTR